MKTVYDKKEYCSGCGACSHSCKLNAIQMKKDEEGFLYPVINQELCVQCGKCKKVCPFIKESTKDGILQVYAAKNLSDEARKNSASGGIFTLMSDYVLQQNGVVYGAVFGEDMQVAHIRAVTEEKRDAMRGSKYVQSFLGDVFLQVEQDVKENRMTLFSGTPCQVAGLKAYLNKDYPNLLCCDIVCHGVTSPKVFQDYLSYLEEKHHSKVTQMCFRDKEQGWSNQKWKATLQSGKILLDNGDVNVYKHLYYSHVMQRPSCHQCPYTSTERQGDITIGDYWGIENSLPEFKDELGVNVLFVNTEKGAAVFEQIKSNMNYVKSELSSCLQPQLQYPTEKSKKRELFWQDYEKSGFPYVAKKYGTVSLMDHFKSKIKRLIGK